MDWIIAFTILSLPLVIITDGWWPFIPLGYLAKWFFEGVAQVFFFMAWLLSFLERFLRRSS